MITLSVIICTHNPRHDYLRRTLDGLAAQTLPKERWELIIIDNASKEPVAAQWDLAWHPRAAHIREDELGVALARLRAIRETAGDLLLYIDDDNVLAPDYMERVLGIAASHPELGAFGAGVVEPEFEAEPEPVVRELFPRLALRTVESPRWSNNPMDYLCIPWGAGLVVRRQTADQYRLLLDRLRINMVLDRRGSHLFGCGDCLFSWAAVGLGLGFGVFPDLKIVHLIPRRRVTRDYLLRLLEAGLLSELVLEYLLLGTVPQGWTLKQVITALAQIRRGSFAFRKRWANLRAEAGAAAFIASNKLRPFARDGEALSPWNSALIKKA
jgi:glycosyltransferase involved in cell wall biosynthesis